MEKALEIERDMQKKTRIQKPRSYLSLIIHDTLVYQDLEHPTSDSTEVLDSQLYQSQELW